MQFIWGALFVLGLLACPLGLVAWLVGRVPAIAGRAPGASRKGLMVAGAGIVVLVAGTAGLVIGSKESSGGANTSAVDSSFAPQGDALTRAGYVASMKPEPLAYVNVYLRENHKSGIADMLKSGEVIALPANDDVTVVDSTQSFGGAVRIQLSNGVKVWTVREAIEIR